MDIFLVDSFTSGKLPFTGNPTMICLVADFKRPLEPELMQKIASEINLSETVFVFPISGSFSTSTRFSLRWFSPTCEVNMCGHGTLSAAEVLWSICHNSNTELTFNTLSGELKATHNTDNGTVSIDLPASPCSKALDHCELITNAIVGDLQNAIVDCQYSSSAKRLLIRLSDSVTRDQLESLTPNPQSLLAIKQDSVKGVIVTVKSTDDSRYDFLSRYFAPWWGNHEDHVTGASHTTLAPYWSDVLEKCHMNARQCSKRGGDLEICYVKKQNRVLLTGTNIIMMKGTLLI